MTPKTLLITGATDGIGLETAKRLAQQDHHLLIHGRSPTKLQNTREMLLQLNPGGNIETCQCDLSSIAGLPEFVAAIIAKHDKLDVLINNAGVYKTDSPLSPEGLDVRFVVNTIAPYYLTQQLLPLLQPQGRVINLSSAAQAPLNTDALSGQVTLADMDAYAQSKLAITLWSHRVGVKLKQTGPMVASLNPGSLLATKMVKEGFGIAGSDISKGAEILIRAALSDSFADAHGQYFDNDAGRFASPHPDALNTHGGAALIDLMEDILTQFIPEIR